MAAAFTQYYVAPDSADLKALQNESTQSDVSADVTLFDALLTAGESTADAARAANPDNDPILITYNVVYTGTATNAEIAAALGTYTNALAVAANVVAATATTAVTDLATVTSESTFELTDDGDPSGETGDITIAAGDLAYSTVAEVTTVQTVYADVHIEGTIIESAVETIVTTYVETLAAGAVVDQSALAALILAEGTVSAVTVCEIGFAAAPDDELDITLAAGSTGTATAASVTFTDAG